MSSDLIHLPVGIGNVVTPSPVPDPGALPPLLAGLAVAAVVAAVVARRTNKGHLRT